VLLPGSGESLAKQSHPARVVNTFIYTIGRDAWFGYSAKAGSESKNKKKEDFDKRIFPVRSDI
jgi:hypothetical protein